MNQDGMREVKLGWIRSVLRRWDPIGIRPGVNGPEDEYDSYAPKIAGLLSGGAGVREVAAYLKEVRTVSMELSPSDIKDLTVATELVELWTREW